MNEILTINGYPIGWSWLKSNPVYIPGQDKWSEHFPTPGKPNPNYYTDSGATFNKHLRTQNKLKQKRK